MALCRVCLASDIRLLNLSTIHLEVYQTLTRTQFNTEIESGMPSLVCYICHRQLQRCHMFSEMACMSNKILQDWLHKGSEVTPTLLMMQSVNEIQTLTMTQTQHMSLNEYSNDLSAPVAVKEENFLEKTEEIEQKETPDWVDMDNDINRTEKVPEGDSNVNNDINNMHYYCDECNKMFFIKCDLIKHLKYHNEERPYSCFSCGKRYKRKSHLTRHMHTHTGERPYSCNSCEKRFQFKIHLTRHMLIHTGEKPYSCSSCDKRFQFNSHFTRHMHTHTGERPYSCSSCDKRFQRNFHLTRHMRIHTGEKPYSCSSCDKTFTNKRNSLEHFMRIHTGGKPYSSNSCVVTFTD